jgi:hypothetical protein
MCCPGVDLHARSEVTPTSNHTKLALCYFVTSSIPNEIMHPKRQVWLRDNLASILDNLTKWISLVNFIQKEGRAWLHGDSVAFQEENNPCIHASISPSFES